jgi:hypothetical protein
MIVTPKRDGFIRIGNAVLSSALPWLALLPLAMVSLDLAITTHRHRRSPTRIFVLQTE